MGLFTPTGSTVNIAATTSSTNVAVPSAQDGRSIRVRNAGSVDVFIAFGTSTIAATTAAGMPIGPGDVEAFEVGPAATHVAAITASGSATIYFTPGKGA